jgi:hypothetical protein
MFLSKCGLREPDDRRNKPRRWPDLDLERAGSYMTAGLTFFRSSELTGEIRLIRRKDLVYDIVFVVREADPDHAEKLAKDIAAIPKKGLTPDTRVNVVWEGRMATLTAVRVNLARMVAPETDSEVTTRPTK